MARMNTEQKAARAAERERARKADRDAYIRELVDAAPPLSQAQIDTLTVLLSPDSARTRTKREPTEGEIRRQKEADERARRLKELKQQALALTACHGCGLQPEQHTYQSAYGMGYHEWEPIK